MAASDPWKRYLDAGMEVTNLTRKRAEKIVKDFVREGAIRSEQAQERVEELLDRSRKASEHLVEVVRTEVGRQMETLGLVAPVKKAVAPVKKAAAATKAAAPSAKKAAKPAKKAATKKAVKPATSAAKKSPGRS
jgi:polyhydroxyalkanoate synthesis regulator phasin